MGERVHGGRMIVDFTGGPYDGVSERLDLPADGYPPREINVPKLELLEVTRCAYEGMPLPPPSQIVTGRYGLHARRGERGQWWVTEYTWRGWD